MTFLNVTLAIGAAASGIPVVIHLLNRRRFDVVRWGAMHLITPILRTNRRRIRLEQLILLLMRMAILALLALCMAGPVLTGWHALSGNAKTSLALLFDNSYSMDAASGAATGVELAKRNAIQLIEHQPRGSDVAVSLMAGGKVLGSTSPTTNRKRSGRDIGELPAGFGPADVTGAFEHATRSLTKMQHAKRDLVIVSDFQAGDWAGEASPALEKATELIDAMPIRPTVTLMQVGVGATDNVSIQSIELSPAVVAVDQQVNIRVNLRNHGEVPYPGIRVQLQVDGIDRHSETIHLGGREDGQLLFQHTFADPGSHVVQVRAEADALTLDNRFLAAVAVWDRLPVLLVDGDPDDDPLKAETGFLQLALSPFLTAASMPETVADETLPRADLLDARVVNHTQLSDDDFDDARVVVLANVPRLSSQQLDAVKEFVQRGNSLLVFPGDRVDTDWYQQQMCEHSGLIGMTFGEFQTPASVANGRRVAPNIDTDPVDAVSEGQPATGEGTSQRQTVAIAEAQIDHPALQLFNDSRHGKLSDAKMVSWYRLFTPTLPEHPDGRGTNVALRLENGDPLLVENGYGKGRVIVCSTTCDDAWNNMPARPFYLPLMQRLVTYLATAVEPRRNLSVGQTIVAQVPPDTGPVVITRPDGKQVEVHDRPDGNREIVEYSSTEQEGLYTLQAASLPAMHYAVVAPRTESELELLDQDQLGSLAQSLGATVVKSTDEFIQQDSRRRYGRVIWRYLYWAMLCLVVSEILLQQLFSGLSFRQPSPDYS